MADPADRKAATRRTVYRILCGEDDGSRAYLIVNAAIVILILISTMAIVLESDPRLAGRYGDLFWAVEAVAVAVFTVEYIARLWSIVEAPAYRHHSSLRARLRHAVSAMSLIDLLAIAPFYLQAFVPLDLLFVRLIRLIRVVRLSRYFGGAGIFFTVLRAEWRALSSVVFAVTILVIVVSCIMYLVEREAQPEAFGSIPQAAWWAIVTMTTVGYGDITPITNLGKVLSMVIMMLSVGLVGLPAGMIAGRFSEELRKRNKILEDTVSEALADREIDAAEMAEIERLTGELGLSEEAAREVVLRLSRRALGQVKCPSCGTDLLAHGPSPRV